MEEKNNNAGLIIILVIIALIIIGIECIDVQKNSDTDTSTTEYNQDWDDEIEDTDGTNNNEESSMQYTDNTDMNIKECLKVDAYQKVESTDGSFEFAYPKYVFNDYDIDDVNNDYNFYYKDEDENIKMQMRVYTEEYEGNPVEKARELYDNFCSRATEVLYQIEPKDEIDGQGMARTIVAGKFDYEDADTCVYYVGASDENRDYIMEFYYPDANPEYDYDDVNYILDCVYRYCSFAGGTYKPRSYEMFLQDDMGVKK